MRTRYVVDTNVLIAASAADPLHPKDIDATPDDPVMRQKVWEWLNEFDTGTSRMILDSRGSIFKEYSNKLGFNDFGIQVVMHKWDTIAVDLVDVAYDSYGDGIIPEELESVIHDRADRKMVAAALESKRVFGEGCVAFAGDTDWHEWEDVLLQRGLILEPVIEEWSRQKFAEKQERKQK